MKYIILVCTALMLSACGAHTPLNEWYTNSKSPVGFKSYDPPSGDWIFIQNEPFAAQRQAEREHGWKWGDPNPPW
jgi:hypothetical protein